MPLLMDSTLKTSGYSKRSFTFRCPFDNDRDGDCQHCAHLGGCLSADLTNSLSLERLQKQIALGISEARDGQLRDMLTNSTARATGKDSHLMVEELVSLAEGMTRMVVGIAVRPAIRPALDRVRADVNLNSTSVFAAICPIAVMPDQVEDALAFYDGEAFRDYVDGKIDSKGLPVRGE